MTGIIAKGSDGYFHPSDEESLRSLVQYAYESSPPLQLRVRGSAHSVAQSIYTDGYDGTGDPPNGAIDVMLDQYRTIGAITAVPGDPTHATVEVQAGCNLGKNPYDPTHTSTWQNSLNYVLQSQGWALDDLGGITHQTVGGFLATGSSGGSLTYSIDDDIVGLRLIDGTGTLHVVSRDDTDPAKRDLFFAAGVSMGLLGVLSTVTLRVRRSFNLYGSQVTTSTAACPIDLFGDGTADKPSLEAFLRATPYTRLMWFPQTGFERMQIWQASRIDPTPGFLPQPYLELGDQPQLSALAGSLFYTLIGNLDDISVVPAKLTDWYAHLEGTLEDATDVNTCTVPARQTVKVADVLAYLRSRLEVALRNRGAALDTAPHSKSLLAAFEEKVEGALPDSLAWIITKLIELLLDGALKTPIAQCLATFLQKELPYIIKDVLGIFVTDGVQSFWDTWMCGLPMDNQMDDQLWPTWFTELWIPVEKTAAVMQALQTFYAGGNDPQVAYQHTGAFSCELYAAKASDFWMSPAYEADVFRVDVFWFAKNAGVPETAFYPQFWELLKPFAFRPHWGKFLPSPNASPSPSANWADYYRQNLSRFDDFLALRAKLDPRQVFVTDYWRSNFAIAKP
jgi:hypothetical protein